MGATPKILTAVGKTEQKAAAAGSYLQQRPNPETVFCCRVIASIASRPGSNAIRLMNFVALFSSLSASCPLCQGVSARIRQQHEFFICSILPRIRRILREHVGQLKRIINGAWMKRPGRITIAPTQRLGRFRRRAAALATDETLALFCNSTELSVSRCKMGGAAPSGRRGASQTSSADLVLLRNLHDDRRASGRRENGIDPGLHQLLSH